MPIECAPTTDAGLDKAIAETHRCYSWLINRRIGWRENLRPEV